MGRRAPLKCCCVVGAIAVGVGCGGDETAETVTEERTIIEKAPPREPAEPTPKAKAKPAPADEGGAAGSGGEVTVTNVVGKDHQLAQDTMQAAGLYALDEQDATGQDRLLIYDRNWTVVRQTPPAGSRVSEDTTITLFSKKDGE